MGITKAEGEELAAQFCSSFCQGFKENNHDETMKDVFADKVSWSWSGGTAGEGGIGELMDIMKNGWGKIISSYIFAKSIVCVDTDQSRIVIASPVVFNVVGVDDLITNNLVQILKLDDNTKKVQRWSAIFDTNEPMQVEVLAKLAAEMPKPMEASKPTITVEEGEAFADEFLKATRDGFAKNNHAELSAHLYADRLSWDMSDGTEGEGTPDEFFDVVAKGWGPMIDSWLFAEPIVAVDTNRSIVAFVAPVVGNVTGGIKTENNAFLTEGAFVVHLNEDKKCYKWHHAWDNNEPALKAAIAKVSKKLEAAAKLQPASVGHSEAVAAGQ